MKIFQVVNGYCHWCTPYTSMAETEGYPPDCYFVEAPDYVGEQWIFDDTKEGDERFVAPPAPEGWMYDEETHSYFPISELPNLLKAAQDAKQNENKALLAQFLEEHPITWIDGKKYGVTMEDQSEIQLNISQYQIQLAAQQAGQPVTPILEWHSIDEACTPWSLEQLSALVLAISDFVYPWFQKMNEYKAEIYACTERSQVAAITFDYRTEEEKAADEAAQNPAGSDDEEVSTPTTDGTEETAPEEDSSEETGDTSGETVSEETGDNAEA